MEFNLDTFYVLFIGLVVGAIFLLSIITFLIYLRTREKSFLYYALYTFFLSSYLSFKMFDNLGLPIEFIHFTRVINWPIQFVYYMIYTLFVITFFSLKINNPRLDSLVKHFVKIMLLVCFGYSLINYAFWRDDLDKLTYYFTKFVLFFFIPVFVPIAAFVLYKVSKLDNPSKKFIILGSSVYGVSAMIAMYLTVLRSVYNPILVFSIGVIIELFLFSMALAMKVHQIFLEKNKYQKGLIHQLEKNKELIEQHNSTLLKEVKKKSLEIEVLTRNELETKFKNRINELKSRVYRSQMNSHFIFNTLNSIKGAIVNDKKEDSIEQLNKFSKLIRKILNNSRLEEVTLQEEIEITRLYFFLENLRFGNNIHFTIKMNNLTASLDTIEVPPFILQPFLENAIWHGLANKEGEKNLELTISLIEDNLLNILIQDNGIGMAKSSIARKRKHLVHKSMGIAITKERLELFSKEKLDHFHLNFENIGAIDNSEGTRVLLNIPIQTKNYK